MKFKIAKVAESEHGVRLSLEGMVTHPNASHLQAVCSDYLRQHKQVELECADIDFVDAKGVAVLNDFPRRQVTLLHAPQFVQRLLRRGDPS